MARVKDLTHQFVRSAPERLEPGVLYVSMEYSSVVHLCCCGCGSEIVTPLSPNDWKLTFNGETISLYPSVGNWSFPCRSHYWIRSNHVKWAGDMTQEEIWEGRDYDLWTRKNTQHTDRESPVPPTPKPVKQGRWSKLLRKLRGMP